MTDAPIISTKERPGSYDAIETAKPDEPLFPVQGGDPFGPPTVLYWAKLAREAGLAEGDPKKAAKLLRKASDAEQVAWAMQAYQRGGEHEAKPAIEESAPIEIDATDHDRAAREARIKGAERLHNLVGIGTEIGDVLAGLDCCPPEVAALRNAIDQIKAVAFAIEPRRNNERS